MGGILDQKEVDLNFLQVSLHHSIPEPTSNFEAVTSGARPEAARRGADRNGD